MTLPGDVSAHPALSFTNSLHFPALPDIASRHNPRLRYRNNNPVIYMDL